MKKRKLFLVGLALAGVLTAASCGEANTDKEKETDGGDTPVVETPDTSALLKDQLIDGDNGVIETIYGAPNGKSKEAGGDGTIDNPYDFYSALSSAGAGDTVYLKGGVYNTPSRITLTNSGNALKYITVKNYQNEHVVLDFSEMDCLDAHRGIQINSDYWHFYGIDVKGAGDNGMYVAGSYNIIENCRFYENQDTGLQLGRASSEMTDVSQWPHNNLIKNCTSFNNYDPVTLGENADGFAAKLTVGEANIFDGCIAYRNSDDGWDLYAKADSGNVGTTIIKNCVSFENGWVLSGRDTDSRLMTPNGDGIGFKLGGSNMAGNVICSNCMAFNNRLHGFSDNSNPGVISISYCTAYNNSVEVTADARPGANSNSSNNFDLARTDESYNNYYGLISYTTNQNSTEVTNYSNDDAFRGSMGYSIVNTGINKYNQITSYIDADSYDTKKMGTSFTGMSDSVFASVDFGYVTSLDLDFHTLLRNEDGSVNMGNYLKVVDQTLLKFGAHGEQIGCNLTKTSWDQYDHYELTKADETTTVDRAICQGAIDAITIMCNSEAVFQDVNLLKKINGYDIVWSSSDESRITIGEENTITSVSNANAVGGIILRDREKNVNVTLTATVKVNNVKLSKDFTMTLIKEVAGLGKVTGYDSRYICEQFDEFVAPNIVVEDINSYTGLLLDAKNDYEIKYTYSYAKSSTSKFYEVSQVYTSVPGVYKVTANVQSLLDANDVTEASFIVYVVSTSAPIDLVAEDSSLLTTYAVSKPLTVAVTRDGVQVTGVFSNILGSMYVLTTDKATATKEEIVASGTKFDITDEYLVATAKNANTAGYYVHVVIANKDENYISDIHTSQITFETINTTKEFFDFVTGSTSSTTIYSLTADLDFTGFTEFNTKKNTEGSLKGLFNGNGHTISNVTIHNTTDKQCNIWYKISGGTIENVNFNNLVITDETGAVKQIAIVGQMSGGYIHNVKINNLTAYGKERVAALVGQVTGGVNYITQVSLVNDENQTIGCKNKYAAGLVGEMEKDTSEYIVNLYIENCSVRADIGLNTSHLMCDAGGYIGGIIGRAKNEQESFVLSVNKCYFTGALYTTKDYAGGIVGGNDSSLGYIQVSRCVSNCIIYWKANENMLPANVIDGNQLPAQKNDSAVYGRLTAATTVGYAKYVFYDNFGSFADSQKTGSDSEFFFANLEDSDFWKRIEYDTDTIWQFNAEVAPFMTLR